MTILVFDSSHESASSLVTRLLVFDRGRLIADGRATTSSPELRANADPAACQRACGGLKAPTMKSSDFAFANEVRAAVELRTPRTSRSPLYWSLALVFVALIWAHFAVLDEVKRGNGRVIPVRQMQVVQTLEGGIVERYHGA